MTDFQQIDFYDFLTSIVDEQSQLQTEFIGAGTYGYAFKFTLTDLKTLKKIDFCVKFSLFLDFIKQGKIQYKDPKRPENVEHQIINLINNICYREDLLNTVIPFFSGIIGFDQFQKFMIDKADQSALSKFNKIKDDAIQKYVKFIVCEYCDLGCLQRYIENNIETISITEVKSIFMQILYIFHVIFKYFPSFKHNDLKPNNILLKSIKQTQYKIKINNVQFTVPFFGYAVKIWDYDFSSINGFIQNEKAQLAWAQRGNISEQTNQYQDYYYFIRSFYQLFLKKIKQFKNTRKEFYIEFAKMIQFSLPKEITKKENDKYRIPYTVNYKTPSEIIIQSNFFDQFITPDVIK